MLQLLSSDKKVQGNDFKTYSLSSSICKYFSKNTEGLTLRRFAILLISLSVKSGPVVLQQFAHTKQLVFSNTSSCNR